MVKGSHRYLAAAALLAGWLTASLCFGQPQTAAAASPSQETVNLVINGKAVVPDSPPVIVKDRVLVPVRVISEQLGLKVDWNSEKYEAALSGDGLMIALRPGQWEAEVNGKRVALDAPAQLRNDRLFVPLRFVGASMGGKIDWDGDSRTAYVASTGEPSSPPSSSPATPGTTSPTSPAGQAPATPASPGGAGPSPASPGSSTPSGTPAAPAGTTNPAPAPAPTGGLYDLDWQIENNKDIVVLAKTDQPQYQLTILGGPDRVVVDLPGAKLGDDLLKNRTINLGPVKQVRLGQFREDMARIVIDVNGPVTPQIEKTADGLRIRIPGTALLRHPGTPLILLDPGHGGSDPGALGPTGKREKDFTVAMALKVRDLLVKQGVDVLLIRSADMDVSLTDRGIINNRIHPDLFFSIHANSASAPEASGTETWIYGEDSRPFAEAIQRKVQPATGRSDRGIKQARFYVLRTSEVPAALLESAFISNPEEEALMFSPDFQDRVARAIVGAMMEYLKRPMRT
ncbi:AMIN domain-containing protein [Heliobacterium gestii]|uniref:AMIN domain-containing protein n=1 Tax=Heliomicrobium gestii TaxID=2699 RepID=A0A845LBI0_HELGE|nr:N-acetylmuramoyl-L-alanine amidase family protein [Heliomicrobium gestii]MBM7866851.1 N-acetylmuramoyl-L-alanine amidase [Heliomicrobium gestii]MZP42280.1 AMIN domain-containing protein [Heliomicrobium gestii]